MEEKKELRVPPIKWRKIGCNRGANLYAIEYIKQEDENLKDAMVFRIIQPIPNSVINPEIVDEFYVHIYDVYCHFDACFYVTSLEEAKQTCENFRKQRWGLYLDRKLIIDENAEETYIKTVNI
jgi:hypothetical protein